MGPWLRDLGIDLIFSWQGAVLAAAVVIFPLICKSARAAMEQVDHHLEDAARTLGASNLKVFLTITMPLAWRSIFAGLILGFAWGPGKFGAPLMVAGNIPGKTQTLTIYAAFQAGDDHFAPVLVTSTVCCAILVMTEYLLGQRWCWPSL